MRLKSIELNNFRCFEKQAIDLSADVVVIYGRNGMGKTAVFDAIELALVGDIGRFAGEDSPSSYLSRVWGDAEPSVCLTFNDSQEKWVKAVLDRGSTQASLEFKSSCGHSNHRDFLYNELLTPAFMIDRREVAIVQDVFRSSILLSQDMLRSFIESKPEDRSRLLSCIAGSAVTQRRLDKAYDVHREAGKRIKDIQVTIREVSSNAEEIRSQVAEHEGRMSELLRQVNGQSSSRDEVSKALAAAAIIVPSPQDNASPQEVALFLATARGACEQRVDEQGKSRDALAKLEAMAQQHTARIERRNGLVVMVDAAKSKHVDLLNAENVASAKITQLHPIIAERAGAVDTKRARLTALKQLPSIMLSLRTLDEEARSLAAKKTVKQKAQREASEQIDGLQAESVRLEKTFVELAEESQLLGAHYAKTVALFEELPSYESNLCGLAQIQKPISDLNAEKQTFASKLRSIQDDLTAIRPRVESMKADLSARQADTEELAVLLGRVKSYANTSKCPLCDHDHGSIGALREAIAGRAEKQDQAAIELSEKLQTEASEMGRLIRSEEAIRASLAQVEQQDILAQSEKKKLTESIRQFKERASALDLLPTKEAITAGMKDLRTRLAQGQRAQDEIGKEIRVTKSHLQAKTKEAQELKAGLVAIDSQQEGIANENRQLLEKAHLLGLTNDLKKEEGRISSDTQQLEEQLKPGEEELSRLRQQEGDAEQEREVSRSERFRLERDMKEWEETLAILGGEIDAYRAQCKAEGLPEDAPVDRIYQARRLLDENASRMREVLELLSRSEARAKATQFQEDIAELKKTLNDLEVKLQTAKIALAELRKAEVASKRWIATLADAVDKVVERRLRDHQPEIVRLFKGMIPCSYDFEDVPIVRDDSGVHLGLVYHGIGKSSGEPRLFLSSAQANVLALAVFLSLARHQHWSHLNSLLLDDPVQHLDDLDAVAFIDCLRSISLEQRDSGKQIIMSTCDKNLYLMMIRKFSLLSKSRRLSFTGISLLEGGRDGPQVVYDVGGPDNVEILGITG